ncbi:MAG: protein kinase [Minicystis sp.]
MRNALPEGTVFAQRYRVVRCIAAGGMGAVYEVVHLETERRCALKVMLPHVLDRAELRERFKREAKITSDIDSEHIIEVFDAGLDDATEMPFIVMELLKGEDLGRRLKRTGRFQPSEVLTYLHQTAIALEETHRASIVHRDLKPDNLFLTTRRDGSPRIKVLDFGIAKLVADSAAAGQTQAVGTPLYMAPEQFRATTHVTPAIDIHALGMIAYTLLVGVPYWREESAANGVGFPLVASLGAQEAATARARRLGVILPAAFDGWFARATALVPQDRFTTAPEAVSALATALAEAEIYARISAPDTARSRTPVMTPNGLTPQPASSAPPLTLSSSALIPAAASASDVTLPERAVAQGAAMMPPQRAAIAAPTPTPVSLATITVTEGSGRIAPAATPPKGRRWLLGAGISVALLAGWFVGKPAVSGPAPIAPAGSGAAKQAASAPAAPATAVPAPTAPATAVPAPTASASATAEASAAPPPPATARAPGSKPAGKAAPPKPRPVKASEDDDIYKRQ